MDVRKRTGERGRAEEEEEEDRRIRRIFQNDNYKKNCKWKMRNKETGAKGKGKGKGKGKKAISARCRRRGSPNGRRGRKKCRTPSGRQQDRKFK